MPGLMISTGDTPQFLFQKFAGSGATEISEIMGAMIVLVKTIGFDTVFGRVFRWTIDKPARKMIEQDAKRLLSENGYDANHENSQQAMTLAATKVIMCHEAYVLQPENADGSETEYGEADEDIEKNGLLRERKFMIGIARVHEDELVTLISNTGCMVTTLEGVFQAMHGIEYKRLSTSDSHEMILFYDEYEESDDLSNDEPNSENESSDNDE